MNIKITAAALVVLIIFYITACIWLIQLHSGPILLECSIWGIITIRLTQIASLT